MTFISILKDVTGRYIGNKAKAIIQEIITAKEINLISKYESKLNFFLPHNPASIETQKATPGYMINRSFLKDPS